MAGKRMIHENVCESKKLDRVSRGAESLWYRILTKVDDNGNFFGDPFLVKAHVFPFCVSVSAEDVAGWLKELYEARGESDDLGLLAPYEVEGRTYIHFVGFHSYQKLRSDIKLEAKFPVHPEAFGEVKVEPKKPAVSNPVESVNLFVSEPNVSVTHPLQVRTASVTDSVPKVKESKSKDKEKEGASIAAPAQDFAFQTYQKKFGERPNWTKKDFVQVVRLIRSKQNLTLDEFKRRWIFYLKSTDPFYAKNGYALGFFCSKAFDALRTGPLDERGAPAGNTGMSRAELELRRNTLTEEGRRAYARIGVERPI